jgi:hypothetical protein
MSISIRRFRRALRRGVQDAAPRTEIGSEAAAGADARGARGSGEEAAAAVAVRVARLAAGTLAGGAVRNAGVVLRAGIIGRTALAIRSSVLALGAGGDEEGERETTKKAREARRRTHCSDVSQRPYPTSR